MPYAFPTDLHHGDVIELPEFLLALPEGRVQDLPGGQLPPDRQVCSEDQSTVMHWTEIPNVDILRADVMCTDAVQRWGRTLVWRRMARTAQGDAPPPPDPVLPARYRVSRAERAGAVDEDGGSASGAGRLVDDAADGALDVDAGAQETGDPDLTTAGQQPEPEPEPQQLPPDQQPRPPRVLPRACPDDPASVEVPYCMRLEPDLPNRTMLVGDGAAEHIFVCNICHKALSARRVPEAALARLDPGDVPRVNHLGDPLPSPTFLEGQLLGRGRIIQQLLIMYLADRPPDVFPRAVKTHGIGVVNPDPNLLRGQLPARASDLAGAITVVCVDQVRSRAELLERVRKAPGLQVRGQVIVAWVRFLQHNDEEELAIDEDALQEYERMGCAAGVPDEILHAALAPTDPEVANVLRTTFLHDRTAAAPDADTAGPVQPTLADPTPTAVDPAAATLDELELILPQPSNVGDDGSEIDRFPGRVEDLLTGRARIAFAAGGRDSHVLDDRHPAILTLCFPQSFPYGFSGQRPRGMSFPAYCRHLLHRVPRTQFGGNLMLLARMYDICVRHESMAQVGITMNMRPHLGEPAARVPRDVIRAMGTILALPYRHSQRRQLLTQQSPLVKALVEGARLSTLRLDLTDAYYNGARSKMRAAALTIGWPPLFFTVNPADMHAACAVVASGQVLDFDDDGRPQHIPSTVEKWRRVKDDPYSCAALLVATKEVLVEELFGFAPGAMQQTNPHCFCGLTFEVAVKVEQSGRLALHIHGVAHVAAFAVERLQALFNGPNCRALALAYALCAMWYPSPYYDPFVHGTEHCVMDMTVEEARQHGRAPPPIDKSCPPACHPMLVEGKPGTGKTQFVQALLWYTFQHGCPHWAATCAYSWAAAVAFNTPVHRSLSTHAMFALSAGSNRAESVRKGSAASLQVHRNVGDGALIIDEIGMNSLDHLGACNQSCTRHLLPPSHLARDHPAATIFSGRPSANTGDEFQHPKPGGPPLYRYAADVECNPQFSPSVPAAQPLHGEEDNDGDPNEAAAGSQGGQQQPEVAARRPRAVPQAQSCILEGFRVYRSLAKTVFLLEKQQRQDSSPSGRRLTEYASMFGGEPATEQRIAEMVDDLNSRAVVDLADLAHLEPRVVLQRNEPRHTLNTRLIMLEAQRKNQRLVVWNADHVPVQKRGAAVEPALTHVEKAVAMRIKDYDFGHTTADTWYYHGARYILLDTTAADAGASHNNEVEACGLLEDGREPADDGHGPYRRLKYLPAAVIVRPINGHIPDTVLRGLADYASRGGAFILSPRASCIAEVEMPAPGCGTLTKQVRRLNVPLGDRQAVTDYFVQGRSFKDECWLVDLAVPPNGIKRATLYVLLTRFKTLDHVRLLRPLYTTPHERKKVIKQFLSATKLEPDLAANLRLLKQAARETEQRYTTEFQHARQLETRWTR
ncbi:hypothetical protein VOLCADRAFT_100841 [Volvox carteri f. nagariensis]|uniref:DUF6570 domain-containing protein n=1 Tax=Volvox carteri f. nagariensis TaxID=3068 RepID=D8UL57_VOLCA|nr:uncharacterized protein VOLCADRAFT_100841 [Volvox carteri f. nagariensis]EFJ39543.1 hypothetical protein VOLCADRAFT_100841 [Volvox carteri f. nagariensis]|eukprot:XP_002959393.1 hypothetical protein VOLCADRAFT_100841 [Volvox carteri f. nagariensis]